MREIEIFNRKFYEYTGSLHIHSKYSFDASGNLENIIKQAQKCEIDFITITEHNNLKPKKLGYQKRYNDLFVIVGYELNDENKNNHYLVFNTNDTIPISTPPSEYISMLKKQGAVGFIAHPIERRKGKKHRTYQWTDWTVTDFDGMEIWNFISYWTDSVYSSKKISSVLFPRKVIKEAYPEILAIWDDYNKRGLRKSAIGSIDLHSHLISLGLLKIYLYPYKLYFNTIRTNIWTETKLSEGNFEQVILSALSKGNSYAINYKRGTPSNFYCGIIDRNSNKSVIPGEEIPLKEDSRLYLFGYILKDCYTKIIHNGTNFIRIEKLKRGSFSLPITQPGFYRLEIFKKNKAWIYTNPIYVVDDSRSGA